MTTLKAALKRAAAASADSVPDAILLFGAGLVSYGAHMIYAPSGFIVGGMFFLYAGWAAARRAGA
jgi:hypothetical protein